MPSIESIKLRRPEGVQSNLSYIIHLEDGGLIWSKDCKIQTLEDDQQPTAMLYGDNWLMCLPYNKIAKIILME